MSPVVCVQRRRYSGATSTVASPSYSGPGDVLGNARTFWGLRAYKASTIGQRVVQIQRASDTATQDFVTTANGLVDVASVTAFLASTTGVVSKLYEQVGSLGSTFDLTVASSNFPSFVISDATGLPCIRFQGAANTQGIATSGTDTIAQPFSLAGVLLSNNASTADGVFFSNDGADFNPIAIGAAAAGLDDIGVYAGTTVAGSGTHGLLHDFVGSVNGASSNMYVDAAGTSGNSGSNTIGASGYRLGQYAGSNWYNGDGKEFGIWASALSGANAANYHSNAHTFWLY